MRFPKVESSESIEESGIPASVEAENPNEFISNQRRYIPLPVRRTVFQRDQCCQHIDKNTGKKCSSRWQLQVDHVQPVWAGGRNALENLQLLCSAHNKLKYSRESNLKCI
ncbi:HNH endonuclease [Bdellovibrio bacteriovorus]|uniref:HNH endonuclease n=1 Tax=Bdellovibrio TaxID=958 RepID=UPI0035A93367